MTTVADQRISRQRYLLRQEISSLTADNEALRTQVERQTAAGYCDAQWLSDGPPFKCGWQHRADASESRADALAQEVERLRELVQKAFKDGVLYGTNVDVSDVWQAWLSSKVRAELAAASRPLPLQETEK